MVVNLAVVMAEMSAVKKVVSLAVNLAVGTDLLRVAMTVAC